jgi:hypothetical protein
LWEDWCLTRRQAARQQGRKFTPQENLDDIVTYMMKSISGQGQLQQQQLSAEQRQQLLALAQQQQEQQQRQQEQGRELPGSAQEAVDPQLSRQEDQGTMQQPRQVQEAGDASQGGMEQQQQQQQQQSDGVLLNKQHSQSSQ